MNYRRHNSVPVCKGIFVYRHTDVEGEWCSSCEATETQEKYLMN